MQAWGKIHSYQQRRGNLLAIRKTYNDIYFLCNKHRNKHHSKFFFSDISEKPSKCSKGLRKIQHKYVTS